MILGATTNILWASGVSVKLHSASAHDVGGPDDDASLPLAGVRLGICRLRATPVFPRSSGTRRRWLIRSSSTAISLTVTNDAGKCGCSCAVAMAGSRSSMGGGDDIRVIARVIATPLQSLPRQRMEGAISCKP